MGTSTNAYIALGYDLGEEGECPWYNYDEDDENEDMDVDQWLYEKLGAPAYDRIGDYSEWIDAVDKHFGGFKPELQYHCSYDYPMFVLTLEKSKKGAWRGDPADVTAFIEEQRENFVENAAKLMEYYTKLTGEEDPKPPKYLLFALWG